MNAMYGFLGEIKHKYDDTVMRSFTRLFQCLPLAATIHDKVFVVHGGLSTQEGGVTLKEIESIPRFREPDSGLMSDLLWSGKHSFHFIMRYVLFCLDVYSDVQCNVLYVTLLSPGKTISTISNKDN